MNRNELKDYFARLKTGQQNQFIDSGNKKNILQEMDRREQNMAHNDPEALADMYRNRSDTSPDHDQQIDTGMFSNNNDD